LTQVNLRRYFLMLHRYGREIGLPIVVLVLVLVFSDFSDVFFTPQNLRNIGVAAAALAAVSFAGAAGLPLAAQFGRSVEPCHRVQN